MKIVTGGVVSRNDLKLLPALSRVGFAESEQLSTDLFAQSVSVTKEGGGAHTTRRKTLDRNTAVELLGSLDSEIATHDESKEATHGAVIAGNATAAARIAALEAELARANRRAESAARDAANTAKAHAEAASASRIAALEAELELASQRIAASPRDPDSPSTVAPRRVAEIQEQLERTSAGLRVCQRQLEDARAQGARASNDRDYATGELSHVANELASTKVALAALGEEAVVLRATAKVSGVLSRPPQCARACVYALLFNYMLRAHAAPRLFFSPSRPAPDPPASSRRRRA